MKGTPIASDANTSPSFVLAEPKIRIAPSLLTADFARLEREVALVEEAGAEVLHLDVMDGHFVPNISFGVPVIASLRERSQMFFDAHLMIDEPQRYAEAFVKAGCDHITFHIETTDLSAGEPRASARADVSNALSVINHIRSLGVSVGVALNPTTAASSIDGIIDSVDMVLVMSVWPGFGGQKFISDVLPKITELKQRLRPDQRLEIDGGVDGTTIASAAQAGADTFVAGTAVFRQPDPPAAMADLERLARSAHRE